jgi:GalNAc-alpha-(1->4)-GalNAc-alpha-(1->3)-diNAcBac-PP-undecaprenol alpha-1,4-N-acetyl-D-galactosaminyltransferase
VDGASLDEQGKSPVRLTLVIPSLASGGAERVMAVLANEWASRGHEVTLMTIASIADDRQALHPAIARVALDMMEPAHGAVHALRNNWRRLTRLRRELDRSRPHAVISFLSTTNVLTLAATRGIAVPVIVAERIDPSQEPIPPVWAAMRRLLYRRADAVVVQTRGAARWALAFLQAEAVTVIPNPVRPASAIAERGPAPIFPPWPTGRGPTVCAVGRLTKQKGFDVLLRAFAQCQTDYPRWSLVILGEGEERRHLEALADRLGIRSAVALPGHVLRAPALLPHADLFVLSSRYEGFPNALLEAMVCGLAVIATDCPSGPREIIRHGVDGVLVERDNVLAMSEAMRQLMGNGPLRKRLGSRAADVGDRFSLPRIMQQWDGVVTHACQRR